MEANIKVSALSAYIEPTAMCLYLLSMDNQPNRQQGKTYDMYKECYTGNNCDLKEKSLFNKNNVYVIIRTHLACSKCFNARVTRMALKVTSCTSRRRVHYETESIY